tara:strand:- start:191 stop:1150 length:960 start_codon:yes stop_codon:yes gene_type:complete
MDKPIIYLFISSAITIFLMPFIKKLCLRFSIIDFYEPRKQESISKVRLGGLAIFTGTILSVLMAKNFLSDLIFLDKYIDIFIFGSSLFFLIGFLDDIFIISPLIRLISQISFSILIWSEGIKIENISLALFPSLNISLFNSDFISIVITIFWIVGLVNALNWIDGLDSLAIGVSSIVFIFLYIIFFQNNEFELYLITLIILGSSIGFLIFNLPPAKILMGDGGSYFLGFNLALMTFLASSNSMNGENYFYLDKAFLMLFIPLLDMSTVIVYRLIKKRSPFFPDRSHFHHRLIDSGISYNVTLYLIFFITFICLLLSLKI